MGGGAWKAIVHRVAKSRTRLSDFHFHFSEKRKIIPHGSQGNPKGMRASLKAQMVKSLPVGDPGSIPGSGRPLGEGNGNPLQYSCLENPMGGGAW